jgi:hypothetical protein
MPGQAYVCILRPKKPEPGHPILQLHELRRQPRISMARRIVTKQPQLQLPYHAILPPVHRSVPRGRAFAPSASPAIPFAS